MFETILDFLCAGTLARSKARRISVQAKAREDKYATALDKAKHAAQGILGRLDAKQQLLRDALAESTALGLQRLVAAAASETSTAAEAQRLDLIVPKPIDGDGRRVPSPLWRMVLSGVLGALLGFMLLLIAVAAGWDDRLPAVTWALLVLPAVLLVLRAGSRQGAQALTKAHHYQEQVAEFATEVNKFIELLPGIQKAAAMSSMACELIQSKLRERQETLMPVLTDTVNAAKLLREVLDMALLNQDGALLDGVIEKLHKKRHQITDFGLHLAHQA